MSTKTVAAGVAAVTSSAVATALSKHPVLLRRHETAVIDGLDRRRLREAEAFLDQIDAFAQPRHLERAEAVLLDVRRQDQPVEHPSEPRELDLRIEQLLALADGFDRVVAMSV